MVVIGAEARQEASQDAFSRVNSVTHRDMECDCSQEAPLLGLHRYVKMDNAHCHIEPPALGQKFLVQLFHK